MDNEGMSKEEIISNLKVGLETEYKSLEMYVEFRKTLSDKVDIDKIEMVIGDERKHIKMVEELISLINI